MQGEFQAVHKALANKQQYNIAKDVLLDKERTVHHEFLPSLLATLHLQCSQSDFLSNLSAENLCGFEVIFNAQNVFLNQYISFRLLAPPLPSMVAIASLAMAFSCSSAPLLAFLGAHSTRGSCTRVSNTLSNVSLCNLNTYT